MTDTALYILIASAFSLIAYLKVNRFFGSVMIFLTGFGILYKAPSDGYIGYIIMAIGFIMIVGSFFESKKKKR